MCIKTNYDKVKDRINAVNTTTVYTHTHTHIYTGARECTYA